MTSTATPRHRADVPTSASVAHNARVAAADLADAQWLDDVWGRARVAALETVSIAATGPREVTIRVTASRIAGIVRMPRAYVYGEASNLASAIADLADAPFDTALNTSNGKGEVVLTW